MPRSATRRCPGLNVDIDKPRYDQSTFIGRAKHFFVITNPLNIFALPKTLDLSKEVVEKYRRGDRHQECLTEDQLWKAKHIYDSAFHPDTGEKMFVLGRMSCQVPVNVSIAAGMMVYYKRTANVIFWQWINQSFNSVVNYTNRAGKTNITNTQLLSSYVIATAGSVGVALWLNKLTKNLSPIYGRFVPYAAVVAANWVNIPIMRINELRNGTPIYDEQGRSLGVSKRAARRGIIMVIISRILMPAPGMGLSPFVMNYLELKGTFKKYPKLVLPLQLSMLGVFAILATPLCCAIFTQRAKMRYSHLETSLKETLDKYYASNTPKYIYYNKGL